jgi:Pyruvate/2-oxoacid:ferredoxin oxidoreductase gamma subunit
VRPGGLVLVNAATFERSLDEDRYRVVRFGATDIATELGNELGGSMVMVGAYVGITGLVGLDATTEAMRQSIPSYRQQHIAANEMAIRAGFDAVDQFTFPAWEQEAARA